jgi:uncharacterized membrane protein
VELPHATAAVGRCSELPEQERGQDFIASPNRLAWAGVALATLVGGVLRSWELEAKTLWLDEAFSLWMAGHAPADLIRWVIRIDHHPPLYYWLLHEWIARVGSSAAAARGLSALAGTLAIPVFYAAAVRLAGRRPALVATALVALSPFLVRYSQEARMYGLLTLAVAAMLAAAAALLTVCQPSRRQALITVVGLGVTQATAMWLHNTTTVLVPAALNVGVLGAWAVWRLGRGGQPWPALADGGWLGRWLAAQGVAVALWLPWAWPFVIQSRVVDTQFWVPAPTQRYVWETLGTLTAAHLPVELALNGWWPWLGLWLVWRGLRSRWLPSGPAWLLVSLWLTPPLLELAVSLRQPIFYDRTLIWTILPYVLLMSCGIVRSRPGASVPRSPWPGLLAGAVLLALNGAGAVHYLTSFEKEAWDRAAAVVRTAAAPGDLLLFNASWVQLPFDYYLPPDDLNLERRGLPSDLFDSGELEPPMTPADLARLDALIAGHEQVWLVYSHEWYTDPDALVPQALAQRLRLVQEWSWEGLRVQRYAAR